MWLLEKELRLQKEENGRDGVEMLCAVFYIRQTSK